MGRGDRWPTFESENPFLQDAPPGRACREPTPKDVDRAVKAARKAFRAPTWRDLTPTARGALLRRLGDPDHQEADNWPTSRRATTAS